MIQRILTNPTYIGDLTQNRSQKINYKVNKKTAIPPESWITIPGTHAPLVEKEQFAAAQSLLKRRGGAKTSKTHLLAGLVFCKTCHSPMTFVTQGPTRTYLVCAGWKKNSKACACHSIREDACEQAVRRRP